MPSRDTEESLSDAAQAEIGLATERSLGFYGALVGKASLAAIAEELKGRKMSAVAYLALGHLVAQGPMSISELAESLVVRGPTVVRLVDRMERDGWVTREADLADARRKLLALTPKARAIWEEVSDVGPGLRRRASQGIDPSDLETAKWVLRRYAENLEAHALASA